jgi:autotransporter-associated beta strand protein
MSRIGRAGIGNHRRTWTAALALACGLSLAAEAAVYTATWKDTASSGWWAAGDGDENRWYRFDDGWDVRREDLATGQWSSSGTKNPNAIVFANGNQAAMTVNAEGGAEHQINQIWFSNSTSRTFAQDGGAYLRMMGDGTSKIEAASGSGTGTYTFNVPVLLSKAVELNPVGGNLVFNAAITNGGYWIDVYGNLQKSLTIGGVLSGSGGLANKQDNVVVLTNNNTFTGGIWVEKGTVQLANHTNALGLDATLNVGTNATLDFQGSGTMWPSAINLYGTGTNAALGALRKTTAGALTLRRAVVTVGADSKIVVTGGGLTLYSNVAAGANSLYVSNTVAVAMSGGELSGSKTSGDGAVHKSGSSSFLIRPGSGLTGSILLTQGEIRQGTGSDLPTGGALVLSDGTTYRSDGTTARAVAKAVRAEGNATLGYSGGGRLTFSGNVDLNAGQRTLTAANDVTVSGAITNGGLTKAGTGTLILLGANTYASGTLVSAGVLQVGSNGTAGAVSGNVTNNAALAFHRTDTHTFGGVVSGTGALTNLAGTLTLSGTSTYSGPTTVAGGTLLVSGAIGSSAVTIGSGATLAGAGTVGSIAGMSGGTVSPGNSASAAGTLTVNGAAALGGGTYTCDVTGTGSTDCDKIEASGAVAAASALTINLPASAPGGFSECTSYSWTIMSGSSASAANMSIGTKWASSGTFGVSASGNTIVVTHTPGAPGKPTVAASDGTATAHVALSWDDVSCETGYVIRRNTVDTYATATAIDTNAANATTYDDATANPGQLYYYWVTATNAGGSTASDSNGGYRRLSPPANVAATDGSSTANVTVTWDAATGASTYHLYRDTDATPAGATALGPQSSGYADAAATPGQLYYYWVVASNSTSSSTSDWSTANSGYRKLATVADVAATENLTDKVTVSWTDGAGETGYAIWRHTADASNSAAYVATAAADATSYDDVSAVAGTDYYYWVLATNSTSASQSGWSASDYGLRLLAEPTTAAADIVFGDLDTTSYTVSWTRGNGDYVLVVARQGGAPTDPADSVVYAANAAMGLGDTTAAGSYVVYKGTGTNVTVTGLSAGTEYTFAVYEFNGVATPNYRTHDEPTASRHTLAAEPNTQASGIVVTGTNEVTLAGIDWTDGNGASRLVVVKAGGAVDAFPVDGANYSASTNFGGGTQIGTGNYVVWAGSGPIGGLTNLIRDQSYHFRVFEFNGTLGTTANFLTNAASGNPYNLKTMAAVPGSNPTGLTVSPIGTNGFTVSWTKGTTGTNTLIVIRAGGNPVDPTDLNSYTADPAFGGGSNLGSSSFVVYNGTGSSVAVTNLAPGTSYTVEASSFNGSGGSENYRGTPTSATASTLMPEPTQASAIAFGTLGATSYAVSFTAGNGLSRLVVAKQGGAVDWTPTDGTAYAGENNAFGSGTELSAGNFLVHRGTSPFTLSGLTAATDYHVRIFEYQGTNATLNYNVSAATGNPSNRYALSVEPTVHGTLSATALSDTEIKLDWTDATGETGYVIVRQAADAGWTAPADGTAYVAGNALGAGTVVYAGTAAGAGSYTNGSLSADSTYYYRIYPYAYDGTPANATYNYYVGGTPGSASATTGKSEPGTSSSIVSFLPASGTTATIAWTNTGAADGTIILVKSGGAVDANPADWNGYAADLAFGAGAEIGTGNFVVVAGAGKHGSATITGLSAGTTYHAAVYPYNGSGSFLNYRTTAPGTASAVILPDPSAATATADGKTLIDLAWTEDGYDVMIVHKAGSASTAPTQGAAYGVGDACGGGTVIFKGDGSALEHVVASGATHHYAFYSYSGNYYSAGLTDSEATSSFAVGETVETFSYTNGTSVSGLDGETGWGGAWSVGAGSFAVDAGSFSTQTNYPAMSGNELKTTVADSGSSTAFRQLGQTYTDGRLYFGYVMNYQYEGAGKYEGLSLFYGTSEEKLFVGEIGSADQQLGIDSTGSATALTRGSGNDYVIVGYYCWTNGMAYASAYKIGTDAVPVDEPTSWNVSLAKASNSVGWVNTVRLAAGATSGGTPGDVYFDEVRIATNWAGIVLVAPTKPEWPTNQSATADGSEMVRLAWTKNGAGSDVMVVHKTAAISTDPTDGTAYSAGNSIDGGTVVYKGSATALEHVVNPGTTNFYKFYSVNSANYYSTGVVATATNAAYGVYEKVNPFSYTNDTAFGSAMVGGQGFGANYWVANSGTWKARTNNATAAADVPKFLDMTGYPDLAGNLAWVADPGNGGGATADRDLASTISTGNFYVAFMMSYQYYGADKWAGLSLMNGGTEKAFFGKGSGANWNTLAAAGDGTTYWSAFDLLPFHSTGGETGNVYVVVGKYNFESKLLQTKAWKIIGNEFPGEEPASWDASGTLGTGIDQITRIRLNVGSSDAGNTIGRVFFDEIRYGTEWAHLIATTCPTWAGSNALNGAAWTAPASTWLGDSEGFTFQSYPPGLGQSGGLEFDWARDGAFATYHDLPWLKNENNNSYWSNKLQMVSAGVTTSRFVASGSGCGAVYATNPALTVQHLNPPTDATATRDGVNTNSQINLEWVRGVSGGAKDTLIVRQTADSGWTAPVDGTTYNANDSLGSGTVVYRGAGTTHDDVGLAPDTTYYYRFYAENWTYYSVAYDEANAATATGTQEFTIDGNPADWRGSASAVLNSAANSLQEYVWTDKQGEVRRDHADHGSADIREFRVYADADWVYFLVRMTNVVDAAKPFVAIGVDTRTNSASTAMNWLADDSGTFIGSGYFGGGQAAVHFPEYQLNVHEAGGGAQIEAYKHDGTFWYGPGETREVAISEAHDAIELKVARSELNLTGAKTARFTVASFVNSGVWNNDGDGTAHVADNTAAAVDALSLPPWGTADNAADLSAWLEDISDADIDFWVDVRFAAGGLDSHALPTTPVLVTPTNAAAVTASPNLSWQKSTDADGEVTGYLLEISTNEQFNGTTGTENGTIQLRVNLDANTTNYAFTTSTSQYWWRVRARDTAGQLSAATTRSFRVVGKLDTEGPRPTLLYIGTDVAGFLAGDYDAQIAKYGPIQSVLDSEIRDTNNVFGFVLRWTDASGVYATNRMRATDSPPNGAGGFAYNIVDTDGRVSPNWDLVEIDTVGGTTNDLWGVDRPFYATNTLATGNADVAMTNYVVAAFNVTNYDPTIEYYLTVSAEDAYADGGSWWAYGSWPSFTNSSAAEPYYSGWCADGPNTARNITTNFLIRIQVTDDDIVPPSPSQALGWDNDASLVVSNAAGRLDYVSGTGQDVLYKITDGALIGQPLSFSFNAYDPYYKGVALGTDPTYVAGGRTLTNTSFVAVYWQTNWANYDAARSLVADTTADGTMLTWRWPSIATQDVTKLWGPAGLDGPLGVTNLIQLDLFDVDNDRSGDQASARQNFGRIVLEDDDPVDPAIVPETLSVVGTGLAREYAMTNLVEWTFPSGADDQTPSPTAVAADVAASDVSHGPAGTLQGTSNVFMNAQFYKPASNRWLTFTLEATGGKTFKAVSLSFDSRVSSLNGPDLVEVFGTMPGGSETLWASNVIDLSDTENPIGTNWNSYSTSLAMPHATNSAVTFKLLARVADTNHLTADANANWYVDNLIVSGYVLGPAGGAQITDHDLAYGSATFSLQASDVFSGIDGTIGATGRAPRVDFWNVSQSVVPITNAFVTNGWSAATNATLTLSGAAPAAADRKQLALGAGGASLTYYARFTATDADVDRAGDWRSVAYTTTNTVYDEDTGRPARGYLYGGPLGVYVEGALTKAVGSGNAREYRINDEQLQTMTATSIAVKVNLYDYSGWTVPVLGFSNSVAGAMSTNGWLTSVHTDDVDTTNQPDAAMEWRLSQAQAATLFGDYESVVNEFRVVSVWDKDDDRQDAGGNNVDNLELTGARLGYLTFLDNDVGQANVQSSYSAARTNWNIPKVYLGLPGDAAASNVLINGAAALDTNVGTAVLADLTNRVYDSQLAKVSAAAPLSIVLPLYDTGGGGGGRTVKGVQRGTSLTQESVNGGYDITNSSVSIGTVAANNATNYRADLSSSLALTRIAAQFPTSTWAFTSFSYADVGVWLPAEEAVSNHLMTATLYDADDNRAGDQKVRAAVALGTLQVVDNDTVAPSLPAAVKANGLELSGPLTRETAAWTNDPVFRVSFEPSVDGEPTGTDLEKTGVAEHRTATDKADVGPDTGTPLAVPAESSLANLGFESGATNWTLSGAEISTEEAYEGTHSLKMTGSTAVQTVPLFNTNGYVPQVTVVGAQFMGAATGTLTVDGLDAAGDWVPGETFDVQINGAAGVWTGGSAAAADLDAAVDQVRVTLTSVASTYWDEIVVAIVLYDGATPVAEANALFTATEQGLQTNYLFAVDRDNNRAGDRKASSAASDEIIPAFGTAYDVTPPTAVPDIAASTDEVGDPTTQFDVSWDPDKLNYEVGPDDPANDNHPTKQGADRDVLSPWRSYKIYYGTFDPNDVPPGDPGPGFSAAFIYTNYIDTGAYSNWLSVSHTNAIADPSGAGTNYLALTNLSQARIRLFDLDFDQDYAVVVVGLDQAGNEGPANPSSWATNNTIKFAVTQGTLRAFAQAPTFPAAGGTNDFQPWTAPGQKAAALYWIAAGPTNAQGGYDQVTKDYDLIRFDAGSFQESSNWTWNLSGSVRTNWFVETNAFNLPRGTVRFYRASYKDRWRRTNVVSGLPQRPLASEEVYALHNIVISEGRNHVGLHGVPYTNTFAGAFGTDTNVWPAGPSAAAGATKVEFYTPGTNAPVTDVYFFGTDANWYKESPLTKVTTNLQAADFFTRGFSLTLPTNLAARGYATTNGWTDFFKTSSVPAMVWHPILRVPTNGFTHVVACGEQNGSVTSRTYNVLALNLPVAAHPGELNLPTNFTKGTFRNADMIYTLDTTTKDVRDGKLLYCSSVDNKWYYTTGGEVLGDYFKPNDVIVIVSRNGGVGNTWQWTYHPTNFYELPTRWMGE